MFLSKIRHFKYMLNLYLFAMFLPYIIAVPVHKNKTFYETSIDFLQDNNCIMPANITFPFNNVSDSNAFSYLSYPLKQCQINEKLKENKGIYHFCKEIFDVIKNITCTHYNSTLAKIESTRGSKEVCKDFKDMKNVFPIQKDYFSGKLDDENMCQVVCLRDFESLCKVLLWLYDIQAQIQNASKSVLVKDSTDEVSNNVTTEGNTLFKVNTSDVMQEPSIDNAHDNEGEKSIINYTSKDKSKKNITIGLDLEDTNAVLSISNISDNLQHSSKINMNNQEPENIDKINSQNKKKLDGTINNSLMEKKAESKETNIFTQDIQLLPTTTDKNKQNFIAILPVTKTNKHNVSTIKNIEISMPSKSPQTVPESNILKKDDFQGEENESNIKEKPTEKQHSIVSDEKDIHIKQTDMDVGDKDNIVTGTKFAVMQISLGNNADEDNDNKDEEQYYNDTENNEGDYPKSEYDNSKIGNVKKVDVKSSVASEVISSNEFSSNYDAFINTKNGAAHESDSIQMVSTFPEQEDSHFFFYFLSIVLILMSGYLIFHNKQKIIALIVEGRHERRRRSHGAGYKKLETK